MVLYIDYQDTINKARELESLAGKLRLVSDRRIGGTVSSLSSVWTGDSADAYRTKLSARQTKIRMRAGELENAAAALRKAAETMKRVEDTCRLL